MTMLSSLLFLLLGAECAVLVLGQSTLRDTHKDIEHTKARNSSTLPKYVLDYGSRTLMQMEPTAPLVYMDKTEAYMPSDIASQLTHTHPTINSTSNITNGPSPLTLDNLNQLNNIGGTQVYLDANDDWTALPSWLDGVTPDSNGKTEGAVSSVIVSHDKGDGTLDAFYFFFFAYNQGNKLLDIDELGDHLGDWEHMMIRFQNGKPQTVYYSQHDNGTPYKYNAVEKSGKRPIGYSGNGTHATWATAGQHDHTIPDVTLPDGPLIDYTSKGALWDPLLSAYYFTVSYPNNTNGDDSNPKFTGLPNPYNSSSVAPTGFMYFEGQWGDNQLPKNDPRQSSFLGVAYKYTAGPNGPRFKGLNRVLVCPSNDPPCFVRPFLVPGS